MGYNPNTKGRLQKLKLKEEAEQEQQRKRTEIDNEFSNWIKNNPEKSYWQFILEKD